MSRQGGKGTSQNVRNRGQPPVKWWDRVLEHVRGRGEGFLRNLEQARRECHDREKWKLFCCGHPLVGTSSRRRNELNCVVVSQKEGYQKAGKNTELVG